MTYNIFGSSIRKRIIFLVIIIFAAIVGFRLFKMQILDDYIYKEKSTENSVKTIEKDAPRGIFYDRNMNIMVSNKPSFTLQIIPENYEPKLTTKIEKMLEVGSGYVNKILSKSNLPKFKPVPIKRNVDYGVIAWVEENSTNLPGVDYKVELQRDYSYGVNGTHIFGYLREVSAEKMEEFPNKYDIGDFIGFTGIEAVYEDRIRGEKGYEFKLVDSHQRRIGDYLEGKNDIPTEKGNDLILTIDAPTQKKAEELFEGKRGALVALDPSTGEVLSMVSAPAYDLSSFSLVTSMEIFDSLRNDEDKPLFNRAVMSMKPPGSTIKPLMGVIGLEEGVITKNTTIVCKGGYRYGRYFKCHGVHGRTALLKAIEESCNTFFYKMMFDIGFERWAKYQRMFGFGSRTGIDLNSESPGIVPDPEYYDKVYGKGEWTKGNLLSLAIGQGELSVTPVQLAQYTAFMANRGTTVTPHLVKGIIQSNSNKFAALHYEEKSLDISKETIDYVRKGMHEVVHGDKGSARWYKVKGVEMAGKTGTAQNPHGEDHALFIAFAPYENPKIAVAVIVENVGFGSTHAAPVARDIIDTYLNNQKEQKIEKLITEKVSEQN